MDFWQCGHRVGGGWASASRMACRTAGRLGCGGGLAILFSPSGLFEPLGLEEGKRDHAHQAVPVEALPRASFEVPVLRIFGPSSSLSCWCACSQAQRAFMALASCLSGMLLGVIAADTKILFFIAREAFGDFGSRNQKSVAYEQEENRSTYICVV
jgi:hypothetical protein